MPQGFSSLLVRDFSGGWNPRDASSELAENESPNCLNVTLDQRGGVVGRLGLYNLAGTAKPLPSAPDVLYYWRSGNKVLAQCGAAVYASADLQNWTLVHTFSTAARAAFADFTGLLVAVHPADAVSTWDATTWAAVAGSPLGTCVAVWQNRVWVANGVRVSASGIGTVATWDATDFNEIREKDSTPITAFAAGPGMDIVGRPGLLVFKQRSTYRINNSVHGAGFGSYTTVHDQAGAAGARAVTESPTGVTAFINDDGIYVSDGETVQLASAKLQPFFTDRELNFTTSANWVAGVVGDRLVFSMSRGAATVNNFTLEFHPAAGWIVPHNFGCVSFADYWTNDVHRLIGSVSPSGGTVYEIFRGGSDDGVPITARYQTRWFEPANGYELRMRRLLVEGRGRFDIHYKLNYVDSIGLRRIFEPSAVGGVWGAMNWGSGFWGVRTLEEIIPFWEFGVARAVSWNVAQTYSTTISSPPFLGDGHAAELGAFALYGLHLDFVSLAAA